MEANPIHRMMDEERARAEAERAEAEPAPTETVWSDYRRAFPKGTSSKARKKAAIRKRFNQARGASTKSA
jgi:hypothetical protein